MACMEHECNDCKYMWFDNSTDSKCPKCGSINTDSTYDEEI